MSEEIDYENVTYEQAEELSIQSKKHWTVILSQVLICVKAVWFLVILI